jgi:cytochrome P450
VTTTAVPGPRGSFLFGMSRELSTDLFGTYRRTMARYPYIVRLVAGFPGRRIPLYIVYHPDGVQRVLSAGGTGSGTYTKGSPFYQEIAAWVGNGLLTSEGDTWKQQRRTLAPLFTPRRMSGYVSAMTEEADRIAARWRTAETVDLHAEMTEYTLRVVARVLFGASVDDAIPVIRGNFPWLADFIRDRGMSPVRLPRSWPTPRSRRATRAQQDLWEVVDSIIEQRRAAAETGTDMVSLLLAARDPETGDRLSDQEVREQVLIFLLAGHETTSIALTFTLFLLGHHPQIQKRVQDEIDQMTGDIDVNQFPYMTMVIKEAMRLYPPAFAIGRFTPTGDVVGGYEVPANSIVVVSPWATHRHPEFWPEPDLFDPDRFEPAAVAGHHRYAYFPFAGGPRACIGNHFAMTEAVVAAAVLLRAVSVQTSPDPVPLTASITLRPARPVPATLTPRA